MMAEGSTTSEASDVGVLFGSNVIIGIFRRCLTAAFGK